MNHLGCRRSIGFQANLAVAAGCIALMVSGASAQSILAESHFFVGPDGWTALRSNGEIPFNPVNPVTVTWASSGGNPSGFLQYVDPSEARSTYAKAPAAFLGDRAASYGGKLSFDLFQSATNSQFEAMGRDVVIQGGGVTLAYKLPTHPGKEWTHFEVPLTEPGWFDDNGTGPAATDAQMKAALGSLSAILIRIEYRTGQDTDGLDNVVLERAPRAPSQPDPAPQAAPVCGATSLPLFIATIGFAGARWGRRRNAHNPAKSSQFL